MGVLSKGSGRNTENRKQNTELRRQNSGQFASAKSLRSPNLFGLRIIRGTQQPILTPKFCILFSVFLFSVVQLFSVSSALVRVRLFQDPVEFLIVFCTEFQCTVVVASSQLNGGRLAFQIKDRQIEMGLGILFV
jgi:hypothetical protein